jgi:hypothetical protein
VWSVSGEDPLHLPEVREVGHDHDTYRTAQARSDLLCAHRPQVNPDGGSAVNRDPDSPQWGILILCAAIVAFVCWVIIDVVEPEQVPAHTVPPSVYYTETLP